jgi:hypothetical protein
MRDRSASLFSAPWQLEELRTENIRLRQEIYLAEQMRAFNTMKTLDYCTVWWVTQFGIECIARREASATDAQKAEFKSYKNFVTRNKKKAEAGFLHIRVTPFSTPNRAAAAAGAAAGAAEEEEEEEFE